MVKLLLIILCAFPGVGHILLGRYLKGIILLVAAALALNGLLVIGPRLQPGETGIMIETVSLIVMVVLWGYTVFSLISMSFKGVSLEAEREQREIFKAGVVDYIKSDFDTAHARFEEVTIIDTDNADALFHLGMTYKHKGMVQEARKAFDKCLNLDPRKWAWEIEQETKDL